MKTQNKLCCISKSMGIYFSHNIRIRLARLNFFFFHPDFLAAKSWVSELSFEVSFVYVLAKVISEYLKMLEEIYSFKFSSFWEIAEITVFWKFSSSLFLYSERTIASTETMNTSEGSSDTQLFGAGKSGGVALSGGLHAHLPQKDIEKKK